MSARELRAGEVLLETSRIRRLFHEGKLRPWVALRVWDGCEIIIKRILFALVDAIEAGCRGLRGMLSTRGIWMLATKRR